MSRSKNFLLTLCATVALNATTALTSSPDENGRPQTRATAAAATAAFDLIEPRSDKQNVSLIKINSEEQLKKYFSPAEIDPMKEEYDLLIKNFECDLHGIYIILNEEDIKIGILNLSDGLNSYYKDKAEILGYTDGSWVEKSTFLDDGYRGKGYSTFITNCVMQLGQNYFGKNHKMLIKGVLNESSSTFQGFRGIIALDNIPSLRAVLKCDKRILRILFEGQNSWVVDTPFGEYTLTKEEETLRQKAEAINQESIASFKYATFPKGEIPSTAKALESVTKHKPFKVSTST